MSAVLLSTGAPAPVAAASTRADTIIALAKTKLGRPWVHYAVGPRAFDCSGLVYYVFRNTGNLRKLGGRRMSASGYLAYFRQRGLMSRTGGQPGDLVVWGGGSHMGIYLGRGKAISTLTNGVRIHGIYAVRARFTAFLHTGMSVKAAQAIVASGATAAPAATPVPATTPEPAAPAGTVTTTVAPAVSPSTAALPKSTTTRRTTVRLNLRSGAGTAAHRIRVLHAGMRLTILRSRHDAAGRLWYKVRLNSGLTGWVASWYTRA